MKNLLIIILLILSCLLDAYSAPKKAVPVSTPNSEVVSLKTQLQIQNDLVDAIAQKAEDIQIENSAILTENTKLKTNSDTLASKIASQAATITTLEADAAALQKAYQEEQAGRLKAEVQVKELKATILQTGRERDVFILLFAAISTLYFYPMVIKLLGSINTFAPLFTAYTWLPMLIAPIIIFLASFYGIRLLIQFLVHLIFK